MKIFYWFQWGLRFLLTLIMAVCYVAIFCAAHVNSKKPVQIERMLQNSRRKMQYNRMAKTKHRTLKEVVKDHKTDIKVASTVSIVIFTFVASWLPSFVAEMSYFRTVDPDKLLNSYSLISHIVLWMVYISPTLNPIIYAMHNTTIRRMVIRVIRDRKVYRTSSTNIATTMVTEHIRRMSSVDNFEVVKNMNPAQPFRKRASTIVGMLKIQKSMNRNESRYEDISDEVIHEEDELVDEVSELSSAHSILAESNTKMRVSICEDNINVHVPGETSQSENSS